MTFHLFEKTSKFPSSVTKIYNRSKWRSALQSMYPQFQPSKACIRRGLQTVQKQLTEKKSCLRYSPPKPNLFLLYQTAILSMLILQTTNKSIEVTSCLSSCFVWYLAWNSHCTSCICSGTISAALEDIWILLDEYALKAQSKTLLLNLMIILCNQLKKIL